MEHMAVIVYQRSTDTPDSATHEIDELSQRILVYLLTNGHSRPTNLVDPAGADDEEQVQRRCEEKLGEHGAGLVIKSRGNQTLSGERLIEYSLTKECREFVLEHKNTLSMPADILDLASRVSRLETELMDVHSQLDELLYKLDEED